MDVFSHICKLEDDIKDKPIQTFTDEDNDSPVTNEDIDENNDRVTEHEDEVQEQQEERDAQVDEQNSEDDGMPEDDAYADEAAEMSLASDYTTDELRDMSYRQLAQILFIQHNPNSPSLDASDLVILDNEIVNAGDDNKGEPIGDDDSSGGGGGDDFGGDDDDGFSFKYVDIHNEADDYRMMDYKSDFDTLPLWGVSIKGLLNFVLRLGIRTLVILYNLHVAFFKFASRHLPRLITSIRATSKLWDAKLILIIPKVGDHSLEKVDVSAVSHDDWAKGYTVLTEVFKWIQVNARPMVKEADDSKIDTAIDNVVSKLNTIGVSWDGYSRNMDLSALRGMRKLGNLIELGYTKSVIPGTVSKLHDIGKMYDRPGAREIANTLRMCTDIVGKMYMAADKLNGDAKDKAIEKADKYMDRVKKMHTIHRGCLELATILATDFQAVMRGYEIACYKGVKNNEI